MTVDLEALARDLDTWQKTINTEWLETFRRTGHITGEYEALFALGLTLTGVAGQARAIALTRWEHQHPEPPKPGWYRDDTPHGEHPHNRDAECLPDTTRQAQWRHETGLTS